MMINKRMGAERCMLRVPTGAVKQDAWTVELRQDYGVPPDAAVGSRSATNTVPPASYGPCQAVR
jgi:hypothetical protein